MKRSNSILAAAFLLVLFALSGYTLREYKTIYTTIRDSWEQSRPEDTSLPAKAAFAADAAEGALNAALDR